VGKIKPASLEQSITYDFANSARVLPYWLCEKAKGEGAISMVLTFIRKWNKWYRVLRCRNGFGRFHSVRYGLWLARS
jgi:hypothetical protein